MIWSGATSCLHYWVAARPLPGQSESGDQYVVSEFADGALVAVIDGLGHGNGAADAAKLAASTLAEHAHEPVVILLKRCHEALRRTRGAVMSIASFSAAAHTMAWVGVGNVEGMLLNAAMPGNARRAALVPRGGIVGDRLPSLYPVTLPMRQGDVLVFATDGIGSMFIKDVKYVDRPRQLVHHIFHHHAKKTDDALILGAQWINGAGAPAAGDNSILMPSPGISP